MNDGWRRLKLACRDEWRELKLSTQVLTSLNFVPSSPVLEQALGEV